jgi:hypothetical protein
VAFTAVRVFEMRKNLMQVITWLMAAAVCPICFIGTNLVTMDGYLSDIIYGYFFYPLIQRFVLQLIALGVITVCLTISYFYIVRKSAKKEWVRLAFVGIGLLVALAFVFSEDQHRQEKLIIKDVCTQFALAAAAKDYETGYQFMAPQYRQTHSLGQFIAGEDRTETCGYPYFTPGFSSHTTVVLLHPKARNAGVINIPYGSLNSEILLEKVDGKWYLTGETRLFPA